MATNPIIGKNATHQTAKLANPIRIIVPQLIHSPVGPKPKKDNALSESTALAAVSDIKIRANGINNGTMCRIIM